MTDQDRLAFEREKSERKEQHERIRKDLLRQERERLREIFTVALMQGIFANNKVECTPEKNAQHNINEVIKLGRYAALEYMKTTETKPIDEQEPKL